ncbi:FMN-binding protein [Streptomyces sp. NPDC057445]|uniref:FMN-binding protein n=1 Tax=Streptomyces sp. NPDC057445 TaxID=3346136 RepID=UPI0036C4A507
MIRAAAATAATAAGIVLLLSLKPQDDPSAAATAAPQAPAPSFEASAAPSGGASAPERKDRVSGAFVGDTVETRQGPVQVRATLTDGRLTGVQVLQGVHDQGPSADAVPRLTQRALAAQNAQIDAVSGATYTSQGYISSLQSALDRARA